MILGISGKAVSCNDTVCEMIIGILSHKNKCNEDLEYTKYVLESDPIYKQERFAKFYQVAFADRLKDCVNSLSGINIDLSTIEGKNSLVHWLKIDGRHPSYRELLQWFGTSIREKICDDFWVQALFGNEDGSNIIITDVRFENEVTAIKDREGIVIRINREGSGAGNHISETALDNYKFDYILENDGTLEDLFYKVKHLLIELGLL